jgi:hypothetical protein
MGIVSELLMCHETGELLPWDERDALCVGDLPNTVWPARTVPRWLAWLPGVVADLSYSSVSCAAGEGFAGRSGC